MSSVCVSEVVRAFRPVKETLAGMSRRPEEARGSKAQCHLPHPMVAFSFSSSLVLGSIYYPGSGNFESPRKGCVNMKMLSKIGMSVNMQVLSR